MKKEKLLELKNKIEKLKQDKAQLQGRINHLMEELKTKYGCTTIEEAKEKVKEMQADFEKLEKKLEKKTSKISKELNIDE